MKMNTLKYILTVIFIVTSIISCSDRNPNRKLPISKKELNEILIDANKLQIAYDTQRVVSFIRLNKWDMKQTKTGIWYQILDSGDGPKIHEGDLVALTFSVHLLSGELCYSSSKTGAKTFKVSRGGVESGLEEGILLLHGGDSARFIMPQYMAHHLLGDGDKIPPLSTIIYHLRVVELISVNKDKN